ncbi:protein farnesyltransferase subunit beta, partial [Haematococcus lacustris]
MLDDDLPSVTTKHQTALERKLLGSYQELDAMELDDVTEALRLLRPAHTSYLQQGLGKLPAAFSSLDASRPWLVYWIIHSLALLGADLPPAGPTSVEVVAFLQQCQASSGGFGGGPMQLPHLAPTYAAVAALVSLGGEAALGAVDRHGMEAFLNSMAVPREEGGGFRVHEGGEADLRACYLAMATAHMLGLDKEGLAQRAAMTYEGGLGGEPGNEAHGGYTFCGLAALALVGQERALDLPALLWWAAQHQSAVEGGFTGRTNKLTDGCYSFWQGGLFPVLQRLPVEALRLSRQ